MPAGCTGGPGPGLVALQRFLCAKFSIPVTYPYNCRNVAGTNSISHHALGRAADLPTNANNPTGLARGNGVVAWAMAHQSDIGLTELIWNRESYPGGRRPYRGQHPHTDHVHISISHAKAWSTPLTAAQLDALDKGGSAGPAGKAGRERQGQQAAPPSQNRMS